jgi:TPR repeat protein
LKIASAGKVDDKKMSGKIFISYRRDDASAWARLIYDRLFQRFSHNEIFMDVDTIEPGVDFVAAIKEVVGACDVLIAVIGTRWLTSSDRLGRRRLDIPEDFVCLEIATALKRNIRVVPVLVEGVTMPEVGELPDDLKALVHRNALQLSHDRFRTDSERLASAVERVLEKTAAKRREREENERLETERCETEKKERLETERLQKEEQEQLKTEHRHEAVHVRAEASTPNIEPILADERPTNQDSGRGSSGPPPAEPVVDHQVWVKNRLPFSQEKSWRPLAVLAGIVIVLLSLIFFNRAFIDRRSPPNPEASQSTEWYFEARPYFDAKEYAKALPLLQKAAGAGNADAMDRLGDLYYGGHGVAQDYAKAREWYQKAADAGDAQAKHKLLDLQQRPSATVAVSSPSPVSQPSPSATPSSAEGFAEARRYLDAKDYANALALLQKAADAGNADAMNRLGDLYYGGHGVAQDYAKARGWYQKAAEASNADAMYNLGRIYQKGHGVAQDYAQAREWYKKAADAGSAAGMRALSVMYENGLGVARDYDQARAWNQKAANAGDPGTIYTGRNVQPTGRHARVRRNVQPGKDVHMGHNVYIGPNVYIDGHLAPQGWQ